MQGVFTALMVAAQKGHVETVTQWGFTALMVAAQKGHVATVNVLLARGADIEAREPVLFY